MVRLVLGMRIVSIDFCIRHKKVIDVPKDEERPSDLISIFFLRDSYILTMHDGTAHKVHTKGVPAIFLQQLLWVRIVAKVFTHLSSVRTEYDPGHDNVFKCVLFIHGSCDNV